MKENLIKQHKEALIAACNRSVDLIYEQLDNQGIKYNGRQFIYDIKSFSKEDADKILNYIQTNKRIIDLIKKLKEGTSLEKNELDYLSVICNSQSIILTNIAVNYNAAATELKNLGSELLNS